jgi:hypothetical protein
MSSHSVLRFAAFELHTATGDLQRGDVLKLAPQPLKVLELRKPAFTRLPRRAEALHQEAVPARSSGLAAVKCAGDYAAARVSQRCP